MDRRDAIKSLALSFGYTASAGTIASVLTNCSAQPELDWQPQSFTPDQAKQYEVLAEMIYPKTNTPGAKDVGVTQFVDSVISNVFDEKGRIEFLKGFDEFMTDCENETGVSFLEADAQRRGQFLDKHETDIPPQYPRIWGSDMAKSPEKNFYGKLKDTMNWAYFSSELVGEQILAYDPIPGEWVPCMPISDTDRSWSL